MARVRPHALPGLLLLALLVTLLVGGGVPGTLPTASAATTISVTTTDDVAATAGACGNAGIIVAPTSLSLREAVCLANNTAAATASPVVVSVPAGHFTLVNGFMRIGTRAGSDITIQGAGVGSSVVDAANASRIFWYDYDVMGGLTVTLRGMTLTRGFHGSNGGAVVGGSGTLATADLLTVEDCAITDSHIGSSNPASNIGSGGGINVNGGSLTVRNTLLSGNTTMSGPGSAIAYRAQGTAPAERLVVTGSTIRGNSSANSSGSIGGSALWAIAPRASVVFTIGDSTFTDNRIVTTSGFSRGAALYSTSGTLTVTGSTFARNAATGGSQQSGGALQLVSSPATLRFNSFHDNVATTGSAVSVAGAAAVAATDNWWGCNGGPGSAGCDTVVGVTPLPRLVLHGTAVPATVAGPGGSVALTADLLTDSGGTPVDPAALGAFEGLPVTWVATGPAAAFVSPTSTAVVSGAVSSTFVAGATGGVGGVTATLDHADLTVPVTVTTPPAITSADHVSFPPPPHRPSPCGRRATRRPDSPSAARCPPGSPSSTTSTAPRPSPARRARARAGATPSPSRPRARSSPSPPRGSSSRCRRPPPSPAIRRRPSPSGPRAPSRSRRSGLPR